MADADVVSCCLHAFVLCLLQLIVGMEELEYITDTEADLISKKLR